ncbi:MAG: formylglycine-generating enzyme family protein [Acidobacteria bacterium]|nr:formylglycine-generating enzyme family protein [Acidobacteriota bacterium]
MKRIFVHVAFLFVLLSAGAEGFEAVPGSQECAALAPGNTFSDTLTSGTAGPEMVVIPAGVFRMGCLSAAGCSEYELPVREVTIKQPFAVSKYVVTLEQFNRFAPGRAAAGYKFEGPGTSPASWVSWADARAYTEWLSEETGEKYRLLSEAEWEYVVRAGSTTPYPWGEALGANHANCWACGDEFQFTAPVGQFAPNAWGLHDAVGNGWEWVEDCWNDNHEGAPSDGTARLGGDCSYHVIRGGSWRDGPRELRSAFRRPVEKRMFKGENFRVARELSP